MGLKTCETAQGHGVVKDHQQQEMNFFFLFT